MTCELCNGDGGIVLWRDQRLRIVRVADADYPAYLRVVWQAHVREMTDLSSDERTDCMRAVFACEEVLRERADAYKINLASLGNQTPHLHWHIIARREDDRHFPRPIWADTRRETASRAQLPDDDILAPLLAAKLSARA